MRKPFDTSKKPGRAAVQTLESLRRAGVEQLPKPRRKASAASQSVAAEPAKVKMSPAAPAKRTPSAAVKPAPTTAVADTLEIIRREVAACTRCHELCTTRTQTVFGVGNPHPKLCFLGEAPGADEDQQGEPFVGRAGQLLTKIIEACTLSRSDVYILNVLKCRPPGNRTPLPHEAANCREYLDRQLALLKPQFICCLGACAAQTLLETDQSIGKMRGQFFDYQGIQVVCTYHPAYLLRNPAAKKDVWDDMKKLMAKIGIKLG